MNPSETGHLSSPALLQKIDKLREQNIGQHVPLPQLVVVGDQSSGKSALLESVTGISFPRDVELCTRHATQITMRRDRQTRVEIRIIPGPQASEEHKTRLEAYIHTMPSSKELRSSFLDILSEANVRMGIRTDMSLKTGTVFSEDILKIEICGPKEDYLTVIDVPGIFRNHTEGVTTKEDIALVNNLVRRYIKDKRTIILAVLPSNVDIATQEILALAEEYDKLGERTLGVLTKPDLVKESSAKQAVCNLVAGKRRPLSLGYYIARNRGADDDDRVEQDALELMFRQEPWSTLPPDRVGIPALKKRLESLLTQITRREFPSLRREITEMQAECQREIDSLGPARPSEREQRNYLCGIAERFEDYRRGAIDAKYAYYDFFDKSDVRLITGLVNLTVAFGHLFQLHGHVHKFQDVGRTEPEIEVFLGEDGPEPSPIELRESLRNVLATCGTDIKDEFPELGDLVTDQTEIDSPEDGIMEWIKTLHIQSRGMDLGTFSPDLLSSVFGEQSRPWDKMVRVYMGEVVRLIHHFMTKALHAVCSDDEITKNIWSIILDPVLQRYRAGLDQAVLLVEVERRQRPFTLNGSFNEEVQAARGKRIREILKSKAWKSASSFSEDRVKMVINLDDVLDANTAKTNEQHLQEEIHDNVCSYYHLAVDRFMDNIFRQAVGYHLLTGPSSPLTVFSQGWVIDLEPKTLELIAGEKEAAKKRRKILNNKSKALKEALETLRS